MHEPFIIRILIQTLWALCLASGAFVLIHQFLRGI